MKQKVWLAVLIVLFCVFLTSIAVFGLLYENGMHKHRARMREMEREARGVEGVVWLTGKLKKEAEMKEWEEEGESKKKGWRCLVGKTRPPSDTAGLLARNHRSNQYVMQQKGSWKMYVEFEVQGEGDLLVLRVTSQCVRVDAVKELLPLSRTFLGAVMETSVVRQMVARVWAPALRPAAYNAIVDGKENSVDVVKSCMLVAVDYARKSAAEQLAVLLMLGFGASATLCDASEHKLEEDVARALQLPVVEEQQALAAKRVQQLARDLLGENENKRKRWKDKKKPLLCLVKNELQRDKGFAYRTFATHVKHLYEKK